MYIYGSISFIKYSRKGKAPPYQNLHTNCAVAFYVQFLVCVMCSLQIVLCAVLSLCYVLALVCVMCRV